MLHVLPNGFILIRQFGVLANKSKKRCLGKCRELMGLSRELPEPAEKTIQELLFELTGVDISICPVCRKGRMRQVAKISQCPFFSANGSSEKTELLDSS
ncbi:MAG: hypothetical protein SVY10_12740 [Thermodesulfobacteriota bacterium]|nr:hypothetical protein [Thermodesulfobacteriota bacterium]